MLYYILVSQLVYRHDNRWRLARVSNTWPQNLAGFVINEKYQIKFQHQITVEKKRMYFFHIFYFYMVVGLLAQSKTSALGYKYMISFLFLLLWFTLWDQGFPTVWLVVNLDT